MSARRSCLFGHKFSNTPVCQKHEIFNELIGINARFYMHGDRSREFIKFKSHFILLKSDGALLKARFLKEFCHHVQLFQFGVVGSLFLSSTSCASSYEKRLSEWITVRPNHSLTISILLFRSASLEKTKIAEKVSLSSLGFKLHTSLESTSGNMGMVRSTRYMEVARSAASASILVPGRT